MKSTVITSILAGLLLAIVCFSIYANSFNNDLVWDDEHLIVNNPYIKDIKYFKGFFTSSLFTDKFSPKIFYRPIQALTLAVDYYIWKLKPIGYHITNCLLHFSAAFSVYFLIMALSNNLTVSVFTALLFAVHPIHTEAVAYISGRADSLVTLFLLAGFISYVKFRQKQKFHFYLLGAIFFVLALLSKECALIFPVLLILYDICFKNYRQIKNLIRPYIPFIIIIAVYVWFRLNVLSLAGNLSNSTANFPAVLRFLTFFKIIIFYIGLLIYPAGLHMERNIGLVEYIGDPVFLFSIVMILAILWGMIALWNKNRLVVFGALWFIITLLPFSNIAPLNAALAEHWLYIPSIGFFLVCSIGILKLSEIKIKSFKDSVFRKIVFVSFAACLLIYSALTIKQNTVWRNPQVLYTWILKFRPDDARVHFSLGGFYAEKKLYDKSIEELKKAIKLRPDYIEAYTNLAVLYADKINNLDEALRLIKTAVQLKPNSSQAHYNLGAIYAKMQDFDKAAEEYKISIDLDSNNLDAFYALGAVYDRKGQVDEAIEMYKKAIKADKNYINAHINLGALYFQKSFLKEAKEEWEKVLEIDPENKAALQNLKILDKGN